MADKKRAIFLTGATGLVGSYLLKTFLEHGHSVYALARPDHKNNSTQRVVDVLNFWGVAPKVLKSPLLQVIEGDVSRELLGMPSSASKALLGSVSEIFHCAAITDMNRPWAEMYATNVDGTRRVLDLAHQAQEAGVPMKVNHVSTAYIYGNYQGKFAERDLDCGQTFDTNYEKSKFEAEELVRQYREKGLWIDVYRPPIVIGELGSCKTFQLKHIYQFVQLASRELFDILPIEGATVSLVPVDVLAHAMYALSQKATDKNYTFHPFPRTLVPVREILEAGSKVMGFRLPEIVPLEGFETVGLTPAQQGILRMIFLSVNFRTGLDSELTNERLEELGVPMPAVDKKLLEGMIKYAKGR